VPMVDARITATSPRYLGYRAPLMVSHRVFRNKVKPIFKPIDFNDLFDSLSFQIGRAVELALDSNVNTNLTLPCPLTGADVAMILRASLGITPCAGMASDVYFQGFIPLQYHTCMATTATAVRNWSIPKFFAENLRALRMTGIDMKDKVKERKDYQQLLFIPVYGTYQDVRQSWQFTYGNSLQPLYSEAETQPFRISDLTIINQSGAYMAPVGNTLSEAITAWNNWFAQLSAVCRPDIISSANTNSALNATLYTRIVTEIPQPANMLLTDKPKIPVPEKRGSQRPIRSFRSLVRVVKAVAPVNNFTQQEVAVSCNEPIIEEVYDLMNNWVLPKYNISGYDTADVLSQWVAAMFYEPYVVAGTKDRPDGVVTLAAYPTVESKLLAGAVIATHQPTAPESTIMQQLMNADFKGQGGWFGQILADFAANTFNIPMLSAVGSLIPF